MCFKKETFTHNEFAPLLPHLPLIIISVSASKYCELQNSTVWYHNRQYNVQTTKELKTNKTMERIQHCVTESVSSWIIWEAGRACSAGKNNTPATWRTAFCPKTRRRMDGLCQLPLMNHFIGKQRAPTGGSSHLYLSLPHCGSGVR